MKDSFALSSEMMANLSHCKVGDEKVLLVPVRVTAYGKNGAEFEITEAPSVEEEMEDTGTDTGEGSAERTTPADVASVINKRNAYA